MEISCLAGSSGSESVRYKVVLCAIFFLVTFFHVWRLADVPRGLYIDETSIGYNALSVAVTSRDEHGVFMPLYFKAFGEYKNPVYVYAAALMFYLFGASEFTLRLTSAVFFMAFWCGIGVLAHHVFCKNRVTTIYMLVAAGFLPWFFTMSRISFETISELVFVTYTLLFLYLAYHKKNGGSWLYPVLAGLFMGLSIYTYSPRRLLTWMMIIIWAVVYVRRGEMRRAWLILGACVLALAPYMYFLAAHPGAMTQRFRELTYAFSSSIGWSDKILIFVTNYARHFGFSYLIYNGDSNLRHATGYGGELSVTVLVLFIIGMFGLLASKRILSSKYSLFLLLNLAAAPMASALTISDTGHVTRSLGLGLMVLLVSGWGMVIVARAARGESRKILLVAVFAVLALESLAYTIHYFAVYPARSVRAFGGYGFKEALILAMEEKPEGIVVLDSGEGRPWAVDVDFYRYSAGSRYDVPLRYGRPRARPGTCVVFRSGQSSIWQPEQRVPFKDLSFEGGLFNVRCYQ